jgi:predicted DCC family thiol-disulfide oxidoreductase YuxK
MSPADAHAIIVFDGTCVLCSGWTAYLLRRDRARRFRFATTQSGAGRSLLRSHGISAENPSTFLLLHSGRAYVASDAVIHMFALIGGPWRAAAVAQVIPKRVRDSLYAFVARNRYRWFGRRASCFVPLPSDRDRFLE